MNPKYAALRSAVFAELRSVAYEARCLWEEYCHCDDPERKRTLLLQHHRVNREWSELIRQHASSCRLTM